MKFVDALERTHEKLVEEINAFFDYYVTLHAGALKKLQLYAKRNTKKGAKLKACVAGKDSLLRKALLAAMKHVDITNRATLVKYLNEN